METKIFWLYPTSTGKCHFADHPEVRWRNLITGADTFCDQRYLEQER